jgi:hypothetical protein
MSIVEQILCLCLSAASLPAPQVAARTADIWYTHEVLSGHRHLLRLSTTDFIVDSEGSRLRRLQAFAEQFAGQTCPGPFTLKDTERARWPKVSAHYGKDFVFQCRAR